METRKVLWLPKPTSGSRGAYKIHFEVEVGWNGVDDEGQFIVKTDEHRARTLELRHTHLEKMEMDIVYVRGNEMILRRSAKKERDAVFEAGTIPVKWLAGRFPEPSDDYVARRGIDFHYDTGSPYRDIRWHVSEPDEDGVQTVKLHLSKDRTSSVWVRLQSPLDARRWLVVDPLVPPVDDDASYEPE